LDQIFWKSEKSNVLSGNAKSFYLQQKSCNGQHMSVLKKKKQPKYIMFKPKVISYSVKNINGSVLVFVKHSLD